MSITITADEKCPYCKIKYLFMEKHKKKCEKRVEAK